MDMHTGGRCYRQSQSLKGFIRERDNYTCQLCGKKGWIVDHIIPWRVSHDSHIANLRVLCHACNLSLRQQRKRKMIPAPEWDNYLKTEIAKCVPKQPLTVCYNRDMRGSSVADAP